MGIIVQCFSFFVFVARTLIFFSFPCYKDYRKTAGLSFYIGLNASLKVNTLYCAK